MALSIHKNTIYQFEVGLSDFKFQDYPGNSSNFFLDKISDITGYTRNHYVQGTHKQFLFTGDHELTKKEEDELCKYIKSTEEKTSKALIFLSNEEELTAKTIIQRRTYAGFVNAISLEHAYRGSQNDWNQACRSTSPGDVIFFNDHFYMIKDIGFEKIA